MYCSNCGKQYEGNFCPYCGTAIHNSNEKSQNSSEEILGFKDFSKENEKIAEEEVGGEEQNLSEVERIINWLCGSLDIPQLSDDQYRNTMVKRNLAELLLCFPIMLWLLSLSYRVYKDEGLGMAIVVFLLILIVFSIILWIFGFGKVEKRLKKYDLIKKEAGKEAAVISVESSNNINPGCIVMVALILFLIVFMSFY